MNGQQYGEVYKQYQVLPAIEQTKILIIERLKVLFDALNIMFQNKLLNKKDDEIIALVKSSTISLFLLLKPKIYEYSVKLQKSQSTDTDNPITKSILSLSSMDAIVSQPTTLEIDTAIVFADCINLFCHEYGITKITYFAGTTKESSIYQIGVQ